ncbi:MAG TPA: hypothetical protein VGO46_14185, partial [Gemmatimonadaceae bacterium]|nr:hypothetical protein [Gemmatimonadaceae bacterium]
MRRIGVRALLVSGAMIVACENARDAKASKGSKAGEVAKGSFASSVATGGAWRDSLSGFTVPAQCARGSLPAPRPPGPVHAAAPKTRADSVKRAHADSMHMVGASTDTAHVVGAWRDSAGGAGGSRADGGATRADTARVASSDTTTPAPKSPKAARADSIARVRAKVRADSLKLIALQTDSAATRRLPGSLFPGCRVVAYYGNPMSKRMGILGEIKPDSML